MAEELIVTSYELAGFILHYFSLALILAFGIHLIFEGIKKKNEISKQFTIGIGLFFSSIIFINSS